MGLQLFSLRRRENNKLCDVYTKVIIRTCLFCRLPKTDRSQSEKYYERFRGGTECVIFKQTIEFSHLNTSERKQNSGSIQGKANVKPVWSFTCSGGRPIRYTKGHLRRVEEIISQKWLPTKKRKYCHRNLNNSYPIQLVPEITRTPVWDHTFPRWLN